MPLAHWHTKFLCLQHIKMDSWHALGMWARRPHWNVQHAQHAIQQTQSFIKGKGSLTTVISNYTKADHDRRKPDNREYIKIKIDSFNDATLNQEPLNSTLTLKSTYIEIFITLNKNRLGSFRDDIFHSSLWFDPQFWTADHPTNGMKEIKTLIQHFTDSLQAAGFAERKVYAEWRSLQTTIKAHGIPRNERENLCIPMNFQTSVSRAGNDVFFKQSRRKCIQYLNDSTDRLAVNHDL